VRDEKFTADNVILCRNTKPLVELAYDLLRRGIACQVEGRQIADSLVALINKWKATGTAPLAVKLADYRERQVQKWMARGKEQKAEEIHDRVETILVLIQQLAAEGKTKVTELVSFIQGMFGDTPAGKKPKCLTLSTIHRAKGKEWPRVYCLGMTKYMPSKWARKDWQMKQETNLMYVMVTRVQRELIDIIVE
jgi:DNA helicase-2/ATP-dependent DNA helicase PcrA